MPERSTDTLEWNVIELPVTRTTWVKLIANSVYGNSLDNGFIEVEYYCQGTQGILSNGIEFLNEEVIE